MKVGGLVVRYHLIGVTAYLNFVYCLFGVLLEPFRPSLCQLAFAMQDDKLGGKQRMLHQKEWYTLHAAGSGLHTRKKHVAMNQPSAHLGGAGGYGGAGGKEVSPPGTS